MADELATLLENGDSLIVKAWPSPTLCATLQRHAAHIAGMGRNILVLDEECSGSAREFGEAGLLFLRHVFLDRGNFAQGNGYACSLWRFSEMLRLNQARTWLKRLGLILVPDGDQVFGNLFEWELMAGRLRDRIDGDLPQFVVVVGERHSPESSLRRILPVFKPDVAERSEFQAGPEHVWWTLWSSQQSDGYAQGYDRQGWQYCGIEPPLAHHAGQQGISQSLLQRHPAIASDDHREALQRELGRIHIQRETDGGWLNAAPGIPFVGAITLRDQAGNPWRSLQACLAAGQRDVLVNVVSRHALLSAYQIANAAFFAQQPLDPVSPMVIDQDAFTILVQLLLRIDKNDRFELARLQDALDTASLSSRPGRALMDFKHELIRHGISQAAESLTVRTAWDWHETREGLDFGRIAYVSLGGHDISIAELDWLREFRVQDQAGTVFRALRQDHVGQCYQPGKICVFEHKTYQVERIDWRCGQIYVAHHDARDAPDYRDIRRVELLEPLADEVLGSAVRHPDGLTITEKVFRAHFRVVTEGFYASSDHWAGPGCQQILTDTPAREYTHGRVAQLSFTTPDGYNLLTPGATVALAQWLNEAAITLFPESHPYFLAVADVTESTYPTQEPAAGIVPRLKKKTRKAKSSADLLIFEDSHSDLGIPRAAIRQWPYLLDLCRDYLTWFLQETSPETRIGVPITLENSNALLPPRDFLTYGQAERDPRIDLPGLLEALLKIPTPQGSRTFTQRRQQALAAGKYPLVDESASDSEESCDFCGTDIAGGEREVFPDGRVRCTACATCGVDRADQLPELYKVALDYFKNTLNIEFAENVDIKLTTPIELARVQDTTFIPTSGFDARTLGLAQARSHTGSVLGEKRHTVLIESGFSPEETAGTLVHELTHIWQYNMLDYRQMRADHGALLIEGHAISVELDFLGRQQTSPTLSGTDDERLKRALSAIESMIESDGVYGQGYRLVAQLGNFEGDAGSLFVWLQANYSM